MYSKNKLNLKRIFIIMGALIVVLSFCAFGLKSNGSGWVYNSELQEVQKMVVNTDIANITLHPSESNFHYNLKGNHPVFGKPKIEVDYQNEQATLDVKAIPKKWMYAIPGFVKRMHLQLFIPPNMLKKIEINTKNGNIDVEGVMKVNRLSLNSSVGNIKVDAFDGNAVNVVANNGSIEMGEVNGEVTIKNQTGSLKGLTLLNIKGKNNINLSNGNVKITLPTNIKPNDFKWNIKTKNGRITTDNQQLKQSIVKQGVSQKIINNSFANNELIISVKVGKINIIH
ncbi:DUF4097 family beta strand repeat-containing protein [Bacillus sp. JJ722]|uniref:DUF4097 family beta strand repeat-containing protein n=1 Tax=Bacillus sp. JJ722 TaxID=3122973 RepID=UPI00300007DA